MAMMVIMVMMKNVGVVRVLTLKIGVGMSVGHSIVSRLERTRARYVIDVSEAEGSRPKVSGCHTPR